MSNPIEASFAVDDWDEQPIDDQPDAPRVTCATVTKTYAGDVDGRSITDWLMAYADDGTATFVGMERISGEIGGRTGTLVLRHVGEYRDGAATASLEVVAGCASGELAGVEGSGELVADPSGRIRLDLDLG
jgi:hypothetical protein